MIVDFRVYTCKPGMMAEWLALYEAEAWPLQQKYLGNNLGFYTSVEGKLHQVVHLWGYESLADRDARRGAMAADPAWHGFMAKANKLGAFIAQENSFLKPAAFAQVK
jgi:hypothetical protein